MGTGSLHDASPRASGRLAMGDSRWIAAFSGAFSLVYGVVGFDPTAGFFHLFVWSVFLLFLVGIEHPPVFVDVL